MRQFLSSELLFIPSVTSVQVYAISSSFLPDFIVNSWKLIFTAEAGYLLAASLSKKWRIETIGKADGQAITEAISIRNISRHKLQDLLEETSLLKGRNRSLFAIVALLDGVGCDPNVVASLR